MTSTRATSALLLAIALGGCLEPAGAARPASAPPASAPPATPATATLPPQADVAAVGVDILVNVATSILGSLFEGSGLFEALGIGGPDSWTRAKLEEIVGKLDHLHDDVAALSVQVQSVELLVQTSAARQVVKDAYTAIAATCYRDRLQAVVRNPDLDVAARNRLLLARAYQIAGELVPPSLGTIDDGCAIQDELNRMQAALVTPDPTEGPYLSQLAKLARANAKPFSEVVRYFAWTVGLQRQALAIVAQAHHRLGQDGDLATAHVAVMTASLRRQEIELLRAAEAYVAYQGINQPFDGSPLLLADLVVARMEGNAGVLTSSLVLKRPWQDPAGDLGALRRQLELPSFEQASDPSLLSDPLAADATHRGYGLEQPGALLPVDASAGGNPYPYPYLLPLSDRQGMEVGRGESVTIARWRSTQLSAAAPPVVTLTNLAAPIPRRTVALQGRNAVTLEVEWTDAATRTASPHDRRVLAHAEALASPVSRLRLVPEEADPRRVRLAVDLPARGLTGVEVSQLAADRFAALEGRAGTPVELVPAGPETPDRYALRLGEGRWLGVAAPAPLPGATVAVGVVQEVAAPFAFELLRDGEAFRVGYDDPADGARRWLYVNEQIAFGGDVQVVAPTPIPTDVFALPALFSEASPNPDWTPFAIPIRNGSATRAVTYTTDSGAYPYQGGLTCRAGPTGTEVLVFDCRSNGSLTMCTPLFLPNTITLPAGATHLLRCTPLHSSWTRFPLFVQ